MTGKVKREREGDREGQLEGSGLKNICEAIQL
jgi:hypothetical protein